MALSNTHIREVGAYWQLRLTWTATQNISANTSSVTAKLYWEAQRSGVGAVYSSSSKSGNITINGTTSTFTATAALSAGGSKLLKTFTATVPHNADGTKTFTLSGTFDLSGISLSGTDYGSETVTGTNTLNTIPRASSLSSSPSFTAATNKTMSVSRSSTSFRHELVLYVKNTAGTWVFIKRLYIAATGTSINTSFSLAESTLVFETLAQRSSADSRVIVQTYKGDDLIGSETNDGTCSSPDSSSTSFGGDFNIGETIAGTITQDNSAFEHTIVMIFGGTTYTLHDKTGVTNWTYNTTTIASSLYAKIPNAKSISGTIRIYTYYNGVMVRSYKSSNLSAIVVDSSPIFSSNQIAYEDISQSTINITGNNQYIIQNKSTLKGKILSAATAKNGATISHYILSANGISQTRTTVGDITIGAITSATNVSLTVTAVDSRGFTTTVAKPLNMIPWSEPSATFSAERVSGYETDTTITLSGSISPLSVNGVPKNTLVSAHYYYKEAGASAYSYGGQFTTSFTMPNYTATTVTLPLDNLKAWNVQVTIVDSLGNKTFEQFVPIGKPLLFFDWVKKSVAFNDFPQNPNEFRVNGRMVFGANMWASTSGGESNTAGAIDLSNSDIVRANGIYFNDVADNSGEGLLFIKTGATNGSTNSADYDNIYMRDGFLYVNGHQYIQFQPGSSNGAGINIGAGGRTIVGAGESTSTIRDNTAFTTEQEYLLLGADENAYIYTNLQAGWASRKEFRFDQNGYFYRPRYKEPNGYNIPAVRSTVAHDDHMLIQSLRISIPMSGGSSFVDISFPTLFTSEPDWVLAIAVDSNASATNVSVYNTTNSGCRIYGVHTAGSTVSYTAYVTVVACGRKTL